MNAEAQGGDGEALTSVLEKKNEQIPHEILSAEPMEGSQVRVQVKVPAQTFQSHVDEVLGEYKRYANIPGFRRGKAPVSLIRSHFGRPARDEAVRKMVPRLAELVGETRGYEVLAQPGFEGWEEVEDKGAVATIILEIRPEIAIKDETLAGIEVEVTEEPVTEERVNQEVEVLRVQNATYEARDGASFDENDALSYDLVVTDEGGNRLDDMCREDDYSQDLKKDLPAEMLQALIGKTSGDIAEADVEEAHGDHSHKYRYKMTIQEVKKRVLPELDDEFAKDVSDKFESLDALRTKIREELERFEADRKRNATLVEIHRILSDRVEFDVPPSLVEHKAHHSLEQTEERLNQMGLSLRRFGRDMLTSFVNKARGEARGEVKTMLIVDQIGRSLNIEVSDEDLDKEIERIAEIQGRKPLSVRAQLEADKNLDELRASLRMRKINDLLIEKATVKVVEKKVELSEVKDGAE